MSSIWLRMYIVKNIMLYHFGGIFLSNLFTISWIKTTALEQIINNCSHCNYLANKDQVAMSSSIYAHIYMYIWNYFMWIVMLHYYCCGRLAPGTLPAASLVLSSSVEIDLQPWFALQGFQKHVYTAQCKFFSYGLH